MHLKIDYEDIKYIDYISFKDLIKAESVEHSDNFIFYWLLKNNITGELNEIEFENKNFFFVKFVEYYTYLRHKEKIHSILKGFNSLIPSDKLNIFSIEEFDLLLSGQIKINY